MYIYVYIYDHEMSGFSLNFLTTPVVLIEHPFFGFTGPRYTAPAVVRPGVWEVVPKLYEFFFDSQSIGDISYIMLKLIKESS